MKTFAVILAAAGKSRRFGTSDSKKPFVMLNDVPVWVHSARMFAARPDVRQLIIVISPEDIAWFNSAHAKWFETFKLDVVAGGKERADSVAGGLEAVHEDIDFIAIHDAARPCLNPELIESVFDAAIAHDAAILATPVDSTVKRSRDGRQIDETVDRSDLYLAQTPQVFARNLLLDLYQRRGDLNPTDEAGLAEHFGKPVQLVASSPRNFKLTYAIDLQVASAILSATKPVSFDGPIDPDDNLLR